MSVLIEPPCDHPECDAFAIVKINERWACQEHCDWALEPIPKPADIARALRGDSDG